MATGKPLHIDEATGLQTEVDAIDESAGAGDAGKLIKANPDGHLDDSFLPPGVGLNIDVLVASEEIAAGKFVNIWLDGATPKIRLADNSNGRIAHGFVRTLVAAAASGSVYGIGELNDQLSSLTPGTRYFLGTSGGITATVPTAGSAIVQVIGVPKSDIAVRFVGAPISVRAA